MDSTPTLPQSQSQSQSQCHSLSIKPSPTKLPIKRKNPDLIPNPNPNPNFHPPKLERQPTSSAIYDCIDTVSAATARDGQLLQPRTTPFKYHRIWTEPDELHFLQGLLHCASHGFSFPKDLHLFYARFSSSVSHSYTKSQLSEKLRRLRKKFRVVSARLARGLHESHLSRHDRALYDLSKKLWSPEFWSTSPIGDKSSDAGNDNLRVDENLNQTASDDLYVENDREDDEMKSSELSKPVARLAAKTVLDVFDQSLNEVRMVVAQHCLLYPDSVGSSSDSSSSNGGKAEMDLERQWQLQRLAELDALAQRLRKPPARDLSTKMKKASSFAAKKRKESKKKKPLKLAFRRREKQENKASSRLISKEGSRDTISKIQKDFSKAGIRGEHPLSQLNFCFLGSNWKLDWGLFSSGFESINRHFEDWADYPYRVS